MIISLQAKDSLARLGQYDVLNGLQSLQWDAQMNSTELAQLGDENYAANTIAPELTGSFEATSTGSLAAFLSRMIYTLDGSGEFQGYLAGTNGTGTNTSVITESMLENAVFDIVGLKKANEVFDRATLIPRAYLSSFQLSATTDGEAKETYSFEADLLEIYRKPQHDLVSLPVTRSAGNLSTTVDVPVGFTVEGATVDAAADYKIVALDLNGTRILPADLVVTAGAVRGTDPDTVALTASAQTAGYSIPQGEKLALIAYKKTPGSWPTITYPTNARFVKADQIDIWLVNPTATFTVDGNVNKTVEELIALGADLNAIGFLMSDQVLRVQSLTMDVDLRREALKQIKKTTTGTPVCARPSTFPYNVKTTLSLYESDLNEYAKLQGANAYGSATPDVLNLSNFENKQWVIAMRYYKTGTPLQTVINSNARVDATGNSVQVGGRAMQNYGLTGSAFAVKGA